MHLNNHHKGNPQMKRLFSLIALVSVAAVAGPLKVGGDVSGALLIPSFDPSTDISAKIGFGGKIAPAVEYAFNDQFSVRGNVGYEYATYSAKETYEDYDANDNPITSSETIDLTSQFLTLDLVAQYAFIPQVFVDLGVGYDINLSSKYKVSGKEGDIGNKANPFVVEAGLGYKVTPEFAITAGYQFPITGLSDGDGETLKLQTITLGVRYDLGL